MCLSDGRNLPLVESCVNVSLHDTGAMTRIDPLSLKPAQARQTALAGARFGGAVSWLFLCVAVTVAVLLISDLPAAARASLPLIWLALGGVVLARLPEFHPHDRFGAANVVTALRAAATLVLGAMALMFDRFPAEATRDVALGGIVVIALDGVDGWLARRTGFASRFGARFDVEVDAALSVVLSVAAWQAGVAPLAIVALSLPYYLFSLARLLWPWLARPLVPSLARKAVCVIQMALPVFLLFFPVSYGMSALLTGAVITAILASFSRDLIYLAARRSAPL
ncbi:CDP-alcohol phosphatidyltransferase family protein [Thioclava sp. BHET1]|nr:CDP-alcohol phosphatidyltransferase family protein [Thioclava sp. BHET1]